MLENKKWSAECAMITAQIEIPRSPSRLGMRCCVCEDGGRFLCPPTCRISLSIVRSLPASDVSIRCITSVFLYGSLRNRSVQEEPRTHDLGLHRLTVDSCRTSNMLIQTWRWPLILRGTTPERPHLCSCSPVPAGPCPCSLRTACKTRRLPRLLQHSSTGTC